MLVLGFSFAIGYGAQTTSKDAEKAVKGWLKLSDRPLKACLSKEILGIEAYTNDVGETAYYIVSMDPEGFVVVAPDDLIEPIIAFASSGTYEPDPRNPLYAMVQRDLPARLKHVKDQEAKAIKEGKAFEPPESLEKSRSKWRMFADKGTLQGPPGEGEVFTTADEPLAMADEPLAMSSGTGTVNDVRVDVLIQSRWNQLTTANGNTYNYYTPNNWYCGCVATALGQILRFYQFPVQGVETTSTLGITDFTIYTNGVALTQDLRGGNDAGGPYVWADMPLIPGASTTEAQRQAIGRLIVDAGSTVHMDYGVDGSSAASSDCASALKQVFGYGNAIGMYTSATNDLVAMGSFNRIVNPNLDAGLPVILGIRNTVEDYGHAIVCDGYGYNNSTLYHHLNMGWGGSDDAWYNMPDVDVDWSSYNTVNSCVYNIFTNGTGEIISGRVLNAIGNPASGVTVTADDGTNQYTDVTDSRGIYAIIKVPSARSFTLSCPGAASTNVTTGTSTSGGYDKPVGNLWAKNFTVATGPQVFYEPGTFTESTVNPGVIDNSITITVYDDTFTGTNGADVSGKVTVANLPAGLTAEFIKDSDTRLTASLAGTASSHSIDVTNLTFTFMDSAFTGGDASAVTDYSKSDLVIDFNNYLLFADFNGSTNLPSGWTDVFVSGSTSPRWKIQTGGNTNGTHPSAAHSAPYNATLYSQSDATRRLVTPAFSTMGLTNLTLKFWHTQELWTPDQDTLKVFYSTNGGSTWSQLQAYTNSIASWTEETIALPAASETSRIAFEGYATYGYGVCVDDVSVSGDPVEPEITTCSLTVNSTYGTPTPSGITTPESNSTVNAWVSGSPVINGTTQYVCAGWTGTGSAGNGTGTNTSFVITNDSTITWQWEPHTLTGVVPHQWLVSVGITNEFESAVTNDTDGDGLSTLEEYWSGTDPEDPDSYLHISGVEISGGNIRLVWQHECVDSNNIPPIYIQVRTNLLLGTWTDVTNLPPVEGTNIWDGASSDQLYYRLFVPEIP